jgi:tRNA G18 (ribose-2'-O)-methylase SpoU
MKILVLHNIRSTHNVGAIFRTADAAGIDKLYLVGYTPAPVDRFGRQRADIIKAALGAEKMVVWESVPEIEPLLRDLKKSGMQIVAVEQAPNSVDYRQVAVAEPVVFVFGNEVEGLPKEVLEKCDVIAEIPMQGQKESLNVSVAVGVTLFGMLKS